MSLQKKKRKYNSQNRKEKSNETRLKILHAAKELFSNQGIKKTTIDQIADKAKVASPTVYALFSSKAGIIGHLGQTFVFGEEYKSLVMKSASQEDPRESLKLAPTITLAIFEMEIEQMSFLWDASSLCPEVESLMSNLENQRFDRQKFIIERLHEKRHLKPEIDLSTGREILWAMTGRELFRKLTQEKGWSHSQYKKWLEESLFTLLLRA